ncbi:MAG: class I SAM-dependent methyltransferase [Synechococcaceae cyanobacterium]|nr:class I SAM-dependent methyltransferase [Synechococcaceae cyanobacterium]
MPFDNFSEINKSSYSKDSVVRYWTHYHDDLFYGERLIIERLRDFLATASLLDVGVGGGRTTGRLLPLTASYTGLDYSAKLIEQCRLKFPDVEFICADACRLASALPGRRFRCIYFSFNGIDCLNESQRQQFQQQAFSMLEPGGRLLFSSHNYAAAKYLGKRGTFARIARESLRSLRQGRLRDSARHLSTSLAYARHCNKEYQGRDIQYIVDPAQGNREIYAWIKPDRQVEELRSAGFRVLAVHDWSGEEHPLADLSRIRTHSAYYLAEKPAR